MTACKGVGENNGYQKPHGAEFVQHDREEGVDRIRIFDNNSDLANDETVRRNKRVIIVDDKALDNMGPSGIATEIFRMFIPQSEWLINGEGTSSAPPEETMTVRSGTQGGADLRRRPQAAI